MRHTGQRVQKPPRAIVKDVHAAVLMASGGEVAVCRLRIVSLKITRWMTRMTGIRGR